MHVAVASGKLGHSALVLNISRFAVSCGLWIASGKNWQSMNSWRAVDSLPNNTLVNQRQLTFGNWRQSCWLSFADWRGSKPPLFRLLLHGAAPDNCQSTSTAGQVSNQAHQVGPAACALFAWLPSRILMILRCRYQRSSRPITACCVSSSLETKMPQAT